MRFHLCDLMPGAGPPYLEILDQSSSNFQFLIAFDAGVQTPIRLDEDSETKNETNHEAKTVRRVETNRDEPPGRVETSRDERRRSC